MNMNILELGKLRANTKRKKAKTNLSSSPQNHCLGHHETAAVQRCWKPGAPGLKERVYSTAAQPKQHPPPPHQSHTVNSQLLLPKGSSCSIKCFRLFLKP